MDNIFEKIPEEIKEEVFEVLVSAEHVRIERIVSEGQVTPAGEWLSQDEREWVILVQGSAEILFEDDGSRCNMAPGDHVFIVSKRRHRVERTDQNGKTIWLAVHYK